MLRRGCSRPMHCAVSADYRRQTMQTSSPVALFSSAHQAFPFTWLQLARSSRLSVFGYLQDIGRIDTQCAPLLKATTDNRKSEIKTEKREKPHKLRRIFDGKADGCLDGALVLASLPTPNDTSPERAAYLCFH